MYVLGYAALLAAPVAAPSCSIGTWVASADTTSLFKLQITPGPTGVEAQWIRPRRFRTDGDGFSNIAGPVISRPAQAVELVGGDLVLTFDVPGPEAEPFRVKCLSADSVSVRYRSFGDDPIELTKESASTPPLGPWDPSRTYALIVRRPTSSEMTALFDADQKDRAGKGIDWSVVSLRDAERRQRTQQLLDAGALQSGDDFYHAAFLFQHGGTPEDYLKAHLLAMIAVARGHPSALWIASATLDRYLQSIGKPQILGTQYRLTGKGSATQAPYDRSVVSDTLRRALRVPSLAERDKQLDAMTAPSTVRR